MIPCDHATNTPPPPPSAAGCEACLASGGRWVYLRICRTCGHVGCCDDSPGKHAADHYHATEHPVMQSFEPGEMWGWCFNHQEELGPYGAAR